MSDQERKGQTQENGGRNKMALVKRGKYYHGIVYIDGKQVWRSLRTGDPEEAEKRLAALNGAADKGNVDAVGITVKEFFEIWYDLHVTPNLSPTTAHSYKSNAELHILPRIGQYRLTDLSTVIVQKMIADHVKEGSLSNTSIRYLYRILRSALNHAVDWEYIEHNVVNKVKPPKKVNPNLEVWTVDESLKFLETVRHDRFFALYATALLSGLRRGEIAGLKWSKVHFDQQVFEVDNQIVYLPGTGMYEKDLKSESSNRFVPFGNVLADILLEHKEKQDEYKKKKKGWKEHGYVFTSLDGTRVNVSYLSTRHFKRMIHKAGVTEIRFHDLRHTHMTELLNAGVHMRVAQQRAGHSNIQTTERYSHVLTPVQVDAAHKVEGRFLANGFISKTLAKGENQSLSGDP